MGFQLRTNDLKILFATATDKINILMNKNNEFITCYKLYDLYINYISSIV